MNEVTRDIAIQNIRVLIGAFSSSLPVDNVRDAEDLLDHGEWGEAFDLLCTQVYEYELPVSWEQYRLIERTGQILGMDPTDWNCLGELVRKPEE